VLDYKKIKNWPIPPVTRAYTRADTVRFAKAIGAGLPGPLREGDQRFLSGGADLLALPMMAVILNEGEMWTADPATGLDWTKTIHAEESIIMHRPLRNEDFLVSDSAVEEVYDKGLGKGALLYERRDLRARSGALVATVRTGTFLRADGGFGGCTTASPRAIRLPEDRPADRQIDLSTPTDLDPQFRLGDHFVAALTGNAPQLASVALLRGVCAFGLAGRAVLALACGNQPGRLRGLGLRYAGPVLAGETLRTEVWLEPGGRALFRVRALERNAAVVNNGLATYETASC
jgi:acyl dehydratase